MDDRNRSVHTLFCPESKAEDTVILLRVEGSVINFAEDGQLLSILDAVMIHHAAPMLAEDQEAGPVRWIGGGAGGVRLHNAVS